MDNVDVAAARLARQQHGVVSVAQLRGLGATRAHIRRRLDRGQWLKADPAVIRVAGAPITWESTVLTAVLAAGPDALASHRTAAALWDLDGCRRGGKPELTVPIEQRLRRSGLRVHRSTDLQLTTRITRSWVPTTSVARTLLDLGAVVSRTAVHVALDDARRRNLTDWDTLLATLVSHARRGRRGVGVLRGILDEHFGEVAATGSGFERLVVTLLSQAGLPPPVVQHQVHVAGRTYRLDLAYPEANVAIELDGSVHLRRDVWEDGLICGDLWTDLAAERPDLSKESGQP